MSAEIQENKEKEVKTEIETKGMTEEGIMINKISFKIKIKQKK